MSISLDFVLEHKLHVCLIPVFVLLQEPEELFETISQTLMNAVDRDAFSGWGAVVHVMSVNFPPLEPSFTSLVHMTDQSY